MIDLSHWAQLPQLFCSSEVEQSVLQLRDNVKKLEKRIGRCKAEMKQLDETELLTLESKLDLLSEAVSAQRRMLFERSISYCTDRVIEAGERLKTDSRDTLRLIEICKQLIRKTSAVFCHGLAQEEVQLVSRLKHSCVVYLQTVIRLFD